MAHFSTGLTGTTAVADISITEFLPTLVDAGFPVATIGEIRERFDPLPHRLAELLIDVLPLLANPQDQELVAWSLLAAGKRSVAGNRLAEAFDRTNCDDVKIAIAAAISRIGPTRIDDWLLAALRRTEGLAVRNLLASAVAKWLPVERSLPALMSVLETDPLAVTHPLGKIGGEETRQRLHNELAAATGPLRRELRQAIKRIDRRLAKTRGSCQLGSS